MFTRARAQPQQPGGGEEAGVGDHPVVGSHRLALDVPRRAAAPRSSRPCRTRWRRAPRGAGRPGRSSGGRPRGSRRGAAPPRRASPPATARGGRARPGRGRSRRCPRRRRAPRRGSAQRLAPRNDAHVRPRPAPRSRPAARSPTTAAPARSSVIDSAPEPTPASSTRAPGKMSASISIGPEVLGIDHLGAAGHLEHEVGQRRAHAGVARARASSAR